MPRLAVEERRSLLVEAAFRVIARGGVEAATTRAICAEAAMPQASFHYAFASRDELLAAVVARSTSDELATVTAPMALLDDMPDITAGIDELLRAGLRAYLNSVAADPEREQAMLTLSQYAQRTPGLEQFARRVYDRYYEIAALTLTAVANACEVGWSRTPQQLAPMVIAATDGLTLAYLATRDLDVCERIVDGTVAMLLGYVQYPKMPTGYSDQRDVQQVRAQE
jgi:DNA-binding transcriptional regulator YbjK